MKLTQRSYKLGDEININKLYKLVAGIERNGPEFDWEWLDTWNGQGSMWLVFDEDREDGDRLIMQYSLIPTPFIFWGKSYLAGKTENCMCHPDYRGKGLYFPHERKYFEEAKKRFQIFFTTAGNATKGAPGAVRRKLGYNALDSWIDFFFLTDIQYAREEMFSRLDNKPSLSAGVIKFFSYMMSWFVYAYFQTRTFKSANVKTALFDINNAPIGKIVEMWNRNKKFYGITVDRNRSYLSWRINQNPYFVYRYLTLYKDERLVGYIIFYLTKNNNLRIEDILAEEKDSSIFVQLLAQMVLLAKREKVGAIVFSTLKGNRILTEVFRKSGFLYKEALSIKNIFSKNKEENPFHVYISGSVPDFQKAYEPANWYITGLVKEGR